MKVVEQVDGDFRGVTVDFLLEWLFWGVTGYS